MHGPVRAPKNSKPGTARIVVEMPKTSKFASLPTAIPVEIR